MSTLHQNHHVGSRILALAAVAFLVGCSGSPQKQSEREGVVKVRTNQTRSDTRSATQIRQEYSSLVHQERLLDQAISLLESSTLSTDPQARAHAYEALAQQPRVLTRVVERGFVDENFGVRSIAAMSVGRARLTGHTELLRILLTDESPFVTTSAVFALSQTSQQVDRSLLAQHLFQDENPGLRAHVAFLLGEMGDKSALPLIKDVARKPMPKALTAQVRLLDLQLSEAMVKLGDIDQLEPLRAALFPALPTDLEATALAVQALGEVMDRSSRGTLAQLSESAGPSGELMPPEILLSIAITMAKLGDQNGWYLAEMFWEDERMVLRADSASVFGWTNRVQDLAKLERMLSDPSEVVRVSAASGLVRRLK